MKPISILIFLFCFVFSSCKFESDLKNSTTSSDFKSYYEHEFLEQKLINSQLIPGNLSQLDSLQDFSLNESVTINFH